MNKPMAMLAACALLAACQTGRPLPAAGTVPPNGRPVSSVPHKVHHATFANGRRSTGSEAEFATECSWPAHAHGHATPRLNSSTVQATDPQAAGIKAEGCAILRFSLSKAGKVNWIEVVSAKPASIGPLALKCLLVARFKPDPHPEATSLVRVDIRKLDGDVAVAALKLR